MLPPAGCLWMADGAVLFLSFCRSVTFTKKCAESHVLTGLYCNGMAFITCLPHSCCNLNDTWLPNRPFYNVSEMVFDAVRGHPYMTSTT